MFNKNQTNEHHHQNYPIAKEEPKKVNERGIPVKKPFTFEALEVQLEPEELMSSDQSFIYLQTDGNVPSAMIPTPNVYDNSIDAVTCHNHLYGHLRNMDLEVAEYEYNKLIDELQFQEKQRILSNISQNVNIIYTNGLKAFVSRFYKYDDGFLNMYENNPSFDIANLCFLDMFNVRTEPYGVTEYGFGSKNMNREINMDRESSDSMINMLECSRAILDKVSRNYDKLINKLLVEDRLDIESLCKFSGFYTEITPNLSPKAYISVATGLLNDIAKDDIDMISEAIEIAITQGSADFYARVDEIKKPK